MRSTSPGFAISSPRTASPATISFDPSVHASRSGLPPNELDRGQDLIEIPRFKKRGLHLGMVAQDGPVQRVLWFILWLLWGMNGLLSLASSPEEPVELS